MSYNRSKFNYFKPPRCKSYIKVRIAFDELKRIQTKWSEFGRNSDSLLTQFQFKIEISFNTHVLLLRFLNYINFSFVWTCWIRHSFLRIVITVSRSTELIFLRVDCWDFLRSCIITSLPIMVAFHDFVFTSLFWRSDLHINKAYTTLTLLNSTLT
jgi:hypothetical protein